MLTDWRFVVWHCHILVEVKRPHNVCTLLFLLLPLLRRSAAVRSLSKEGRGYEEHSVRFFVGSRRLRSLGPGSLHRGSREDGAHHQHLPNSLAAMGLDLQRLQVRWKDLSMCWCIVFVLFLSTTELKIPSRTLVLQGWCSLSDVSNFKHEIISKRFELEGGNFVWCFPLTW